MIWMDLGDNRQEGRFEGAIAYAFVHLFSRVLYLAFSLVLGELQPFDLFDVCAMPGISRPWFVSESFLHPRIFPFRKWPIESGLLIFYKFTNLHL